MAVQMARQLRVACDDDEHPPEVQAAPTDGSDCAALAGKSKLINNTRRQLCVADLQ